MPDKEDIYDQFEKSNAFVADKVGNISPFYLKMIEQFSSVLMNYYGKTKQSYEMYKAVLTNDSLNELFLNIGELSTLCTVFSEQIEKSVKERTEPNRGENNIFCPLFELRQPDSIDEIPSCLDKIFEQFDKLLFTDKTFTKIAHAYSNNEINTIYTYTEIFSGVILILYEPLWRLL